MTKILYLIVYIIGLITIPIICFFENLLNLWEQSFFFRELKGRYIKAFKCINKILREL